MAITEENYPETGFKVSDGRLLVTAIIKYRPRVGEPFHMLKDSGLLIAFESDSYILVAKRRVYLEEFQSCNPLLVERALEGRKILVMFVKDDDCFYQYDPETILNDPDSFLQDAWEDEDSKKKELPQKMFHFRKKLTIDYCRRLKKGKSTMTFPTLF